jgi:hypothetical protein
MANRYFRPRRLSVREQGAHFKRLWPAFETALKGGKLVCRGIIRPHPLARAYRVRIEYSMGSSPRVFVEEPELIPRHEGEPVPHTYDCDVPCLYLPGTSEWQPQKVIAETVVGWLSLWLLYYEHWLTTGDWKGEGVHLPSSLKVRDTAKAPDTARRES